jgi:hypothetical protein
VGRFVTPTEANMSQPADRTWRRLEREVRLWRWLAAVVVTSGLVAWSGGVPGPKPAQAQQPRARREDRGAVTRMEYRQSQATYTRIAEVVGEWESKGWEVFQVVPVFPANPGVGAPMTVAIVFRRPAK